MAYSKDIWVLKNKRLFMVGPELQNRVLENYAGIRGTLCPTLLSRNQQESLISVDSSALRHFGFFELGSVAFLNLKSIHPFDGNLSDHEWKCWIFMNREPVTKAYPSLSTEWVRFRYYSSKKRGTEKNCYFPLRNKHESIRTSIYEKLLATERFRTRLDP